MKRRRSRLFAAGLALSLLATSCGDDEGSDSSDTVPTTAAATPDSEESSGADSEPSSEPESEPASEPEPEPEPEPESEPAPSGGSGDSAEWCSLRDEADAVNEAFDSFDGNPASIEEALTRADEVLSMMRDRAPREISGAVDTVADGFGKLIDALEDVDFNLLDADLSVLADDGLDARMDEASRQIDEYTRRECGVSFGMGGDDDDGVVTPGDDGDFDPTAGTLREQLIEQFVELGFTTEEAECLLDRVDLTDPSIQAGDPSEILDAMNQCGIDMSRLSQLG